MRSSAPELVWLWRRARCSRRVERDVQQRAGRLLVFEALCQDSQRQGLDFGSGLNLCGAVAEHAGKLGDLGDPATIVFTVERDLEGHIGTLAPDGPPNKALQPTPGGRACARRVTYASAAAPRLGRRGAPRRS